MALVGWGWGATAGGDAGTAGAETAASVVLTATSGGADVEVPLLPVPLPLLLPPFGLLPLGLPGLLPVPLPLLLPPGLLLLGLLPPGLLPPGPLPLVPEPAPAPVPDPDTAGEVNNADPADPGWAAVTGPLPEPTWPGPPGRPAPGPRDAPGEGALMGGGPEAGRCSEVRGGRTRIETAESRRKAIAPPDITMTGTVLPAGWRRKTAPACPTPVLIRSASSASASCAAGSAGQYPIRADSRSLRSAARRSAAVRPESR